MLSRQFLNENETLVFASKLAKAIPDGCLIFLHGALGAGKTTFARGFLRGLGYTGKVKSPTYTLIEPYELSTRLVYHADLYRIKDPKELTEFGFEDYFLSGNICLIEWPEIGGVLLPKPDLACYLSVLEEGRDLKIEALTKKGEEILTYLDISNN